MQRTLRSKELQRNALSSWTMDDWPCILRQPEARDLTLHKLAVDILDTISGHRPVITHQNYAVKSRDPRMNRPVIRGKRSWQSNGDAALKVIPAVRLGKVRIYILQADIESQMNIVPSKKCSEVRRSRRRISTRGRLQRRWKGFARSPRNRSTQDRV